MNLQESPLEPVHMIWFGALSFDVPLCLLSIKLIHAEQKSHEFYGVPLWYPSRKKHKTHPIPLKLNASNH